MVLVLVKVIVFPRAGDEDKIDPWTWLTLRTENMAWLQVRLR